MCGRFVASRPVEEIVEQFGIDEVRIPLELLPGPRFNVSPQDEVLAVREVVARPGEAEAEAADSAPRTERRLSTYRWGLVPSWAKSPSAGARAFNARAETLAERPMFRTALAKRRCIVPADAFYEWQRLGGLPTGSSAGASRGTSRTLKRQPWCFKAADGKLLAFAGLYELWRETRESEWLRTCTIITTDANSLMAPIHDRMPVILAPAEYEAWLAPGTLASDELHELLRPVDDDFLVSYRVGPEVGNSSSEGPQLVEPLEESSEPPVENSSSAPPAGPASP
ncbi:MAG: SOS response-associated peptidase [Acidimicrobiales bacterium]|jgi:putative SOS response-associated peptidase YedK